MEMREMNRVGKCIEEKTASILQGLTTESEIGFENK